MASVNVRKETNRLYIDFRYQGVRYRKQTRLSDNKTNRQVVSSLAERIEAEILLDVFDLDKTFPNSRDNERNAVDLEAKFTNFAKQWVAENSVGWRASYRKTVDYLLETKLLTEFGDKEVMKITREDILGYRASLCSVNDSVNQKQLSPRYVNRIIGLLSSILREASIRFDFSDPTVHIKPLKVRNAIVKPFTLEQIKLIIDEVPACFQDYFIVRFFTGLRTGELHGLRWENVDIEKRQITVCESVIDGVREMTKSAGSDRIVQMSDLVHQAFVRLQSSSDNDYVFTRNGRPLSQSYVTQSVWYPALKRLNLPLRRPYECRHAAASHWLSAGENYAWVSQQLGHSNSQVLFSVYSNFIKDLTRNDGSAVNKMLNESALANAV